MMNFTLCALALTLPIAELRFPLCAPSEFLRGLRG